MNPAGIDQRDDAQRDDAQRDDAQRDDAQRDDAQRDHAQRERAALDVVAELLEVPDEQRVARLVERCGSDELLRHRVLALLRQITRDVENSFDGSFTESTRQDLRDDFGAAAAASGSITPTRIGAYQILRHLGAGGMGDVYEAEQDRPRRRVALKLLRRTRLTPAMMRRFEYEAEWLGRLDHEGIARIYEAGAAQTPAGIQPYFALELIDGQRLDQWLREHKPPLEARVRLLIDLCDAVHHAHQRGIIHRDLKPANILVTKAGRAKILDFGVARAMGQEAVASGEIISESTTDGSLVGTLQYMSPEQVAGQVRDIDTRSDVYALGMIAYELLSGGRRPYELSDKPIGECLGIVQQLDSPPLGTIDRELRGDLETIVAKALCKEKDRRYGSAGELGADLRRYLDHEPVLARRSTVRYQIAKFARRHKRLVASAMVVLLTLVAGIIGTSWGLLRAEHARAAEQKQRVEAQQSDRAASEVSDFLSEMLTSGTPEASHGKDVTVRQVLDKASSSLQQRFPAMPQVEARLQRAIGRAYLSLGLYAVAQEHFNRDLALCRQVGGDDAPETLEAMGAVAICLRYLDKPDEAARIQEEVWQRQKRVLGEDHPATIGTLTDRAIALYHAGRLDQAEPLFRDAFERSRRVNGEDDRQTIRCLSGIAAVAQDRGRLDEAESLSRALVERHRRAFGPDHPETLSAIQRLAEVLEDEGKLAEAEPICRELLETTRRVMGPDHPDTIASIQALGLNLQRLDRPGEAVPLLRDAYEKCQRAFSSEDLRTVGAADCLAQALEDDGKPDEAEALFRMVIEKSRPRGEDQPRCLTANYHLLRNLAQRQKWEQIDEPGQAILRGLKTGSIAPLKAATYLATYAYGLRESKRYHEAEPLLLDARQRLIADGLTGNPLYPAVNRRLAEICDATGRPDEAARWRQEATPISKSTNPSAAP